MSNSQKTICLNLIVKNDADIILDRLQSVHNHITDYVIINIGGPSDTTVPLIQQYYNTNPLPGHIIDLEFVNFGETRTEALNLAKSLSQSEYILFIDPDMQFIAAPGCNLKSYLFDIDDIITDDDVNNFLFNHSVSSCMHYLLPRLVKRNIECNFVGVTHEYFNINGNRIHIDSNKFGIEIIDNCGLNTRNINKFELDAQLLEKELEKNDLSIRQRSRSLFYLGNSYRDCKKYDLAIENYQNALNFDEWDEQRYLENLNIYKCLCFKNINNYEILVEPLYKAIKEIPERIEAYYYLMCETIDKRICTLDFIKVYDLVFCNFSIQDFPFDNNQFTLFNEYNVIEQKFPYYMALFLYLSDNIDESKRLFNKIISLDSINYINKIKLKNSYTDFISKIRPIDTLIQKTIDMFIKGKVKEYKYFLIDTIK